MIPTPAVLVEPQDTWAARDPMLQVCQIVVHSPTSSALGVGRTVGDMRASVPTS
eukprot:COSAG05_NODE_1971_length_3766_cov_556.224434_4_plen_54_part_00